MVIGTMHKKRQTVPDARSRCAELRANGLLPGVQLMHQLKVPALSCRERRCLVVMTVAVCCCFLVVIIVALLS